MGSGHWLCLSDLFCSSQLYVIIYGSMKRSKYLEKVHQQISGIFKFYKELKISRLAKTF